MLNFIGIIFGGINFSAHFWFIWGLISAYIFIPILGTFINTYNKDAFKYLIIITFIVSILYTIGLFNYPRLKFDFKVPFYFFSVLGYFILGSYIHNTEFKQSKSKLFGLSILTFIIGLIGHLTLILIKGNATHTLSPIDFLNIFVILETIGLFGIFKFADIKMISSNLKPLKETKLGEIIVLFSNCSFGIYLCHYLIMEYLMYMGFLRPLKRNHIIFNLPICFIIILALSWILIYIMSKIPYLKIGSGTK